MVVAAVRCAKDGRRGRATGGFVRPGWWAQGGRDRDGGSRRWHQAVIRFGSESGVGSIV